MLKESSFNVINEIKTGHTTHSGSFKIKVRICFEIVANFSFTLYLAMKTQRPPKLYGETVRPLLVDCHPDWNEKEISDAVQRNWDRASNDIKMIYLQPIIQ